PVEAPTWARSNDEENRSSDLHARSKHALAGAKSKRVNRALRTNEHVNDQVSAERANGECATHPREKDWRIVDRALRTIAARRAALDAEEARWLREAEGLQIWRRLGMVNAIDYMERVLGYRPRSAEERLRVARALGSLPGLENALATGELSFSAVREL